MFYTTSPSGWMEEFQFVQWLQKVFIPGVSKLEGEKVLFLDGHSTHITLQAIELCIKNQIRLICLSAHSSYILQPLDVGVYCHVKDVWRSILQEFCRSTGYQNLDKLNFPTLLKKLYSSPKYFTSSHAISGFKKTGLFPLNIANIDKKKLEIAQTFNKNLLNEEGTSNESQSSQSFAQIQTEKAIGLVEKAKICL